jgi:hypothetical protein
LISQSRGLGDVYKRQSISFGNLMNSGAFRRNGSSPQSTTPGPCDSHNSTAAKVADWANTVGNIASGTAVVSGAAALATSETIVGGLTFGGIAAGAEVVGLLAAGVQAGAQYLDGNYGGMRGSLRSGAWTLATGFGVSRLYSGVKGMSAAEQAQQKYLLGLHNEAGSQILQNMCR